MTETLVDIEAAEIELGALPDRYADLAFALDYWTRKRLDRFAPARADIDPLEIKDLLPRIMLADIAYGEHGRAEFRYRLSGTGIGETHGSEMTGHGPLDLDPPAYGALIDSHYREAVVRRAPLAHLITMCTNRKTYAYARIILPLSSDGETIDILMTIDSGVDNSLHDFLDIVEALGKIG